LLAQHTDRDRIRSTDVGWEQVSCCPSNCFSSGGNPFTVVCAALTRGNKEETADDEDTSPDYRTDSIDQLQQKVPNLLAQMNGIAQNPTTAQIPN